MYSPCGTTRKACETVLDVFPYAIKELQDITDYTVEATMEADVQLALFAIPSYGGRVPKSAMDKLRALKGKQTPAILMVCYGNRDYDDTLLELKDEMEGNGFVAVASIAAICQHSIMPMYGSGRPDEHDIMVLKDYADRINQHIIRLKNVEPTLQVKGTIPYREYHGVALKPEVSNECTLCGHCAAFCPVNAIDPKHLNLTNLDVCITCMRCVVQCPVQARHINPMMLKGAAKSMEKVCSTYKENELQLS